MAEPNFVKGSLSRCKRGVRRRERLDACADVAVANYTAFVPGVCPFW